ncbi:54s ribosomal protein l4 [Moniliophthora roreri MCA 2997]|uniref:Large ribosomal subunit protein uL29m n=1 Tax=Moniliophthora roreri (strain MCA 2997) TaxID=1381753 RepID=V2XQ81_MONRO|nr:54s ribosomal protein l4 [Moniliophthora roreri MCA 2997]
MFALPRRCAHLPSLFSRSFAEIVPSTARSSEALRGSVDPPPPAQIPDTKENDQTPKIINPVRLGNRVPVREDHGLYAFFRKRLQGEDGRTYVGEAQYETIGGSLFQERAQRRSWKASELRLKSFQDLHTLWYVLLRERNLLATQKEEVRRIGAVPVLTAFRYKTRQVKKSMARIKYVMNERRLAYEGAVKLAEQEKQDHLDRVVLDHQMSQYYKERKQLRWREANREKRQEAKEAKTSAKTAEVEPVSTNVDVTTQAQAHSEGSAQVGSQDTPESRAQ